MSESKYTICLYKIICEYVLGKKDLVVPSRDYYIFSEVNTWLANNGFVAMTMTDCFKTVINLETVKVDEISAELYDYILLKFIPTLLKYQFIKFLYRGKSNRFSLNSFRLIKQYDILQLYDWIIPFLDVYIDDKDIVITFVDINMFCPNNSYIENIKYNSHISYSKKLIIIEPTGPMVFQLDDNCLSKYIHDVILSMTNIFLYYIACGMNSIYHMSWFESFILEHISRLIDIPTKCEVGYNSFSSHKNRVTFNEIDSHTTTFSYVSGSNKQFDQLIADTLEIMVNDSLQLIYLNNLMDDKIIKIMFKEIIQVQYISKLFGELLGDKLLRKFTIRHGQYSSVVNYINENIDENIDISKLLFESDIIKCMYECNNYKIDLHKNDNY